VGDLECLYKACLSAISDGGLFTDTGVHERGENERKSEKITVLRKPLAIGHGAREPTRVGANKTKEERIVQIENSFDFRVKLMRGQGKWRRISSSAE